MEITVRHSELPEGLYSLVACVESEVEGTHRRLAFRDGEFVDAFSMARLKA